MAKGEQWRNRIVGEGVQVASQFVANPANWRVHPQAQRDAMRGVLNEIGWVQRVIVNKRTGYLIDGHERVEQALQNGDAPVPYVEVDLDEAEEAYVLATLDPIGAMAQASNEQLGALLAEVQSSEAGVQAMLAEVAKEAGLYKEPKEAPEPQIDRAEELREKWHTERGQVWEVGKHRLMCGDSTSKEDVGRLYAGARLAMVWTDPPYGVSYGAKNRYLQSIGRADRLLGDIEGDDMSPVEIYEMVCGALRCLAEHAVPGAVAYVAAPAGPPHIEFIRAMNDSGFQYRHQLIWLKNQLVFGRSDYMYKHEPVLYGWLQNGAHYFEPVTNNCTVFEFDRPRSSKLHPTEKPVELVAAMIANSSKPGDIIGEAFAGSGTDFCAAEQLGRICYGMEIEPKYCAVILERMAGMGLEPTLT